MNRRREDRLQEKNPPILEYEKRRDADRARQVKIWGPQVLEPAGHPEHDVHDYLIDTLIEGVRHAQAMEKKTAQYKVRIGEVQFVRDGVKMAREIEATLSRFAFDLIQLRQQLIRRRHNLGIYTKHGPFMDRRKEEE
jgi:hypothetical protein